MPALSRYYKIAVAVVLTAGALYAGSVTAQDGRRGGGEVRQSTRRDMPVRGGGQERRNDVAVNRDNRGGFDRGQAPVASQRNIERDRPSVNRNFDGNRNVQAPRINNRPDNRNFNGDRNVNRDFNRNNNGIAGRPSPAYNNNRPGFATASRPGYRPFYGYNRNPVYSAYSPSWRYSFLPRRNSYFYSVPGSYFSLNFGGIGYRYWDGVFYRPYNNMFTVIAPPVGIFINVLPFGNRRILVNNYPYYYYNGTYYDQRGSNYYVVSPPVGAVVESLPEGYQTVVIDGETFYTIDGAQYKPVVQENGEIWYEVIKAN